LEAAAYKVFFSSLGADYTQGRLTFLFLYFIER